VLKKTNNTVAVKHPKQKDILTTKRATAMVALFGLVRLIQHIQRIVIFA
jgi:23S rRNA maturation mini-RNase III